MTRIVFATFGSGKPTNATNREAFFKRCREMKVNSVLATRAHPAEIIKCIEYGKSYLKEVDFWLDSGAFSAWTKGKVYKVEEYYDFIMGLLPQLKVFRRVFAISLDKIPGRMNEPVTPDHIKKAIDTTIKNTQWLTAKGLNVVPIHHQGEPLWVMEEYLKMAEYVGISPANDSAQEKRLKYVQSLWQLFKNSAGKIKPSHNFGNVAPAQLKSFPFYSADASTWQATTIFGTELQVRLAGKNSSRKTQLASYRGRNHPTEAAVGNIKKYQTLESDLRKLWKLRGILWENPQGLDLS